MKRKEMKKVLKTIAKPVKNDLFKEIGYSEEELKLMKYLYIDKIEQGWVSDELGISISTLTKLHNSCIEQLISFFNYEKYKLEHDDTNNFKKYFHEILIVE